MTTRVKLELAATREAQHRIQALPLTVEQFGAAEREGLPGLEADDVRAALAQAELSRFRARAGDVLSVSLADGRRLHLLGRGPGAETESLRRTAARLLPLLPDAAPWSLLLGEIEAAAAEAAVEGLLLGSYQYRRNLSAKGRAPGPGEVVGASDEQLRRARGVAEGSFLARDLINTPALQLGPGELAQEAAALGERHGYQVQSWTGGELLERGFRLVDAVGRGSGRAPTVTVLTSPACKESPELAIVGKGVVFDSGGLNLKGAAGMALMRKDMGGAGTVLGALEVLGQWGRELPLMAVIPAAENMLGPHAYRPGDVFEALDGTTVEISNTDAEGRLLLADGLCYARQHGARRLLDLATLTGAARVALGPDYPALFGTDEELVARLLEVSEEQGEPLWRLPLIKRYAKWLESPFADVNHMSSDNRGGAITAALFLKRFAGALPWSHIDLYAWEDKGQPEAPRGANGMVVRTLATVLDRWFE